MQCLESQRVSYKRAVTNVLPLDIPLEAATNKAELADYQVGLSEVQSDMESYMQPSATGRSAGQILSLLPTCAFRWLHHLSCHLALWIRSCNTDLQTPALQ